MNIKYNYTDTKFLPIILASIYIENIYDEDIINNEITINIPHIINGYSISTIGTNSEPFIKISDEVKDLFYSKINSIKFNIEEGYVTIVNFEIEHHLPIDIDLELPSSIKVISNRTFNYCRFKKFSMENCNIKEIYPKTFFNSEFFEKVTLPKLCKNILPRAFSKAIFHKGIIFNEGLEKIEESAFEEAIINNKNIIFPFSLTKIEQYGFYCCKLSDEISFAKGSKINEIGTSAFSNSSVKKVTIQSEFKNIKLGEKCFCYCRELKSLDLSQCFAEIIPNEYCFNCDKLISLKLPKNLTIIRNHAFQNCSLKALTIPKSIYIIGDNSFANNEISELKFEDINNLHTIGCAAFMKNNLTTLPKDIFKNLKICDASAFDNNKFEYLCLEAPQSSTILKSFVFADNKYLKEVKLTNTKEAKWENISEGMFANCIKLKTISIPPSVIKLSERCFSNTDIEEIKVPNIEIIENYVFNACFNLSVCDFSQSTKIRIDREVFVDCKNLNEIKMSPFLQILDISYFSRLTTKQVENAIKNSPFVSLK